PAAYMPWAIVPGIPNAFAVRFDRCIGLRSPETAAKRRPISFGNSHCPVIGGGSKVGRVGRGGRSVPGKSTARDKYSAIDCHSNLSVVGSKIWAQTSTVVPAWCGTRFCAQVEIRTGWSIGTSDICQTLCCKCTVPSNGSGKRDSAIIAIDKPKAVMCAVKDGAELCPMSPEADNKLL